MNFGRKTLEERHHEVWVCLLDRWIFKGRFTTKEEADSYVAMMKEHVDLQVEVRSKGPSDKED